MARAKPEPCDSEPSAIPTNVSACVGKDWVLERLLGSGSQGSVWLGRPRRGTGSLPAQPAAIKLLRNGTDARNELAAYTRTRSLGLHPNVLALRFAVVERDCINLGFEVCKTDLLEIILSEAKLSETQARQWTLQLVAAVGHLHSHDIAHLDVKLENLFVTEHGHVKLGDLGLSAYCPPGATLNKVCGSGVYAAPEVVLAKEQGMYDGRAADVWSIGVCAFIMVRGRFPFDNQHSSKLLAAYKQAHVIATSVGSVPISPPLVLSKACQRDAFSPHLLMLLNACVSLVPERRPSAHQLSGFAWVADGRHANAADLARRDEASELSCNDEQLNSACTEECDQMVSSEVTPPCSHDPQADEYNTPNTSPVLSSRKRGSEGAPVPAVPVRPLVQHAVPYRKRQKAVLPKAFPTGLSTSQNL